MTKASKRRRRAAPVGDDHHNGNGVIRGLIAQTAAIGSQVEAQTVVITEMARLHRELEAGAAQGRRELHNKIDAVKDDVRKAQGDVAQVARDVATMQPIVSGLAQTRERVIGAGIAAKAMWAVGGGAVTAIAGLVAWVVHLLNRMPHLQVPHLQ
jgi:hypothetical protein